MPQFHTRDGELIEFESRRDPLTPSARLIWCWLARHRFPILLALVNSLIIGSSTGGVVVTLVATYLVAVIGYRFAKRAVDEAAFWSRKMSAVDSYRARAHRM